MLKLCCDCIAGSNRDTENTYNPTTSEHFPSVQWTSRKPGNMFRIPRPLKMYDSIEIKGEVQRRESIMFSLCLENNSRVHKIEVNFLDRRIYKYTDDGERQEISEDDPADIIPESSFTLALRVERQDDDGKYFISLSIDSFDLHDFNYTVDHIVTKHQYRALADINPISVTFEEQSKLAFASQRFTNNKDTVYYYVCNLVKR